MCLVGVVKLLLGDGLVLQLPERLLLLLLVLLLVLLLLLPLLLLLFPVGVEGGALTAADRVAERNRVVCRVLALLGVWKPACWFCPCPCCPPGVPVMLP